MLTPLGTPRRPRMPQYGFRIVFSWFWVLQGTSGNDLRSLFATIFEAKSIGFRIRFRYFVDEENSDFVDFLVHMSTNRCGWLGEGEVFQRGVGRGVNPLPVGKGFVGL